MIWIKKYDSNWGLCEGDINMGCWTMYAPVKDDIWAQLNYKELVIRRFGKIFQMVRANPQLDRNLVSPWKIKQLYLQSKKDSARKKSSKRQRGYRNLCILVSILNFIWSMSWNQWNILSRKVRGSHSSFLKHPFLDCLIKDCRAWSKKSND